ncbi:phage tail tip fiber protein, partial [Xenorhabdus griffiniae]
SNTQKAVAESTQQFQAQFKNQQAIINSKMQAEFNQSGNGYAIHSVNITIKHNGRNYNAAGMVISGEVKNGNLESYIGFSANNFAFYNPVNGRMEPFMVVKNGQLFVREAFIDMANIRQLLVGLDIKSTNYIPNQRGFRIDAKTGYIEINGSGNGYRVQIKDSGWYMFDNNGRAIIELGEFL